MAASDEARPGWWLASDGRWYPPADLPSGWELRADGTTGRVVAPPVRPLEVAGVVPLLAEADPGDPTSGREAAGAGAAAGVAVASGGRARATRRARAGTWLGRGLVVAALVGLVALLVTGGPGRRAAVLGEVEERPAGAAAASGAVAGKRPDAGGTKPPGSLAVAVSSTVVGVPAPTVVAGVSAAVRTPVSTGGPVRAAAPAGGSGSSTTDGGTAANGGPGPVVPVPTDGTSSTTTAAGGGAGPSTSTPGAGTTTTRGTTSPATTTTRGTTSVATTTTRAPVVTTAPPTTSTLVSTTLAPTTTAPPTTLAPTTTAPPTTLAPTTTAPPTTLAPTTTAPPTTTTAAPVCSATLSDSTPRRNRSVTVSVSSNQPGSLVTVTVRVGGDDDVVAAGVTNGAGAASLVFTARGPDNRSIRVDVVAGAAACSTSYRIDD